jgi:catechol 2,3-dioxygenase-like lactoylglutathione lyase family enzyme
MLADKGAMATIAVKDLAAARKFYESTLHLKRSGSDDPEVSTYKSGSSTIMVYKSQYAGTNKATAATWNVGSEFDSIVRDLKNAGVKFEHYEMPGSRLDGDIHVFEDFKAAWFKDPDGNILNINNG